MELSSSRAALPPTCTASSVFTIVLILGPLSGPVRGTPILQRGNEGLCVASLNQNLAF